MEVKNVTMLRSENDAFKETWFFYVKTYHNASLPYRHHQEYLSMPLADLVRDQRQLIQVWWYHTYLRHLHICKQVLVKSIFDVSQNRSTFESGTLLVLIEVDLMNSGTPSSWVTRCDTNTGLVRYHRSTTDNYQIISLCPMLDVHDLVDSSNNMHS